MENTSSNSKALLPVYLIAGEDELKKERVLDRLHKRLEKMGDLSFNSELQREKKLLLLVIPFRLRVMFDLFRWINLNA